MYKDYVLCRRFECILFLDDVINLTQKAKWGQDYSVRVCPACLGACLGVSVKKVTAKLEK